MNCKQFSFQKNTANKTHVFYCRRSKRKVLLENCKCFFKQEKYYNAKSLFLLGYGPSFISVSFTMLLINGDYSLFAMRDEFKYLTKHFMLFGLVPK